MAYQKTVPTPTDASIILTYRCPMKCKMCNIWFNPTNKSEGIKAIAKKMLRMKFDKDTIMKATGIKEEELEKLKK